MDRYSARVNLHGTTYRERIGNRLKTNLSNKSKWSLSFKDNVKINGVQACLVIDSGTQPYFKSWKSLPNQDINIGDYVEWSNSFWLVTTCDSDDEFYKDGKLEQCNYLLKWQNEHGEIVERWSRIQSASKYNDGTDGNAVITIGSDQLSVVVPLDEETVKLKKSFGKKFFIDSNKTNPTTYELTGTGNVVDTYNGHGVTSWIVKECTYTPSKEDLKYGVCDFKYFKHEDKKVDYIEPNETKISSVSIVGNTEIKIGQTRTYTATLLDSRFNNIDWQLSGYMWNAISDFNLNGIIDSNNVSVTIDDESAIDKTFILQLIEVSTNRVISELEITVLDVV